MLHHDMPRPATQGGLPTKAQIVLSLLGKDEVAKICGWRRVQKWRYVTGRMPIIPRKHRPALSEYAASRGLELPADLFVPD